MTSAAGSFKGNDTAHVRIDTSGERTVLCGWVPLDKGGASIRATRWLSEARLAVGDIKVTALFIAPVDRKPGDGLNAGCLRLNEGGRFMVYGPFNYDGQFTSDSNRQFDGWLKAADPQRGIRDKEWIEQEFARHGRQCLADHEMPANNRVLVFG